MIFLCQVLDKSKVFNTNNTFVQKMQSALSADDPHETCESVWNGWRGHQELIGWSLQLLVKQTEAIPFFLHCWWTWYDHSPSLLMFSSRNCVESFISVWFKKWGGHCLSDFIPVGKVLSMLIFNHTCSQIELAKWNVQGSSCDASRKNTTSINWRKKCSQWNN